MSLIIPLGDAGWRSRKNLHKCNTDTARTLLKRGQPGFELIQNSVPTMKPLSTHLSLQTRSSRHPMPLTLLQPRALTALAHRQHSPSRSELHCCHPHKGRAAPRSAGPPSCVLPWYRPTVCHRTAVPKSERHRLLIVVKCAEIKTLT